MQYTQAGHNCVPSSLVLLVSDLASSDDSMPESRIGACETPAAAADAAVGVDFASATAAALVDFLFALGTGPSDLTGVSDTVDEADDADDVGLRQVLLVADGRGDGWPICETVLHRLPSGGIFA